LRPKPPYLSLFIAVTSRYESKNHCQSPSQWNWATN